MELVRAVGADDQDSLLSHMASDEGKEVARGAVGPVQVLQDEQDRLTLAQPCQEREEPFEQTGLGPLRRRRERGPCGAGSQLRDKTGELAHPGVQQIL